MSRQHSKRKRAFLDCLFWIIDFYYLFSYFFFFFVAPRNSCILVHRIIHSLRSRHRRHNGLAREKCWWKFNVGIQFRSPFCIFTDSYVHFTLLTTALFLDRLPLSSPVEVTLHISLLPLTHHPSVALKLGSFELKTFSKYYV